MIQADQFGLSQGGIMVSLDIVNLFPNTPTDESLQIIENRLGQLRKEALKTDLTVNEIMKLVRVCEETIVVQNELGIFKQTQGASMGGGLSCLKSDVFMEEYEKGVFQERPNVRWVRYRDDTFMNWMGTIEELQEFVNYLNSIDSRIQWTYETEIEGKINFLDVLVQRTERGIETSVYRKPTHSDRYINFLSNHNTIVFINTMKTMTHRAIKYCSTSELLFYEIHHLEKVFAENGYPEELITRYVSNGLTLNNVDDMKSDNKNDHDKESEQSEKITLRIPFDPHLNKYMLKVCKRLGIKLASCKSPTLGQQLIKRRPKTSTMDTKGVVYEIKCTSCDCIYIGQTGRALCQRITEHKLSCKNVQETHCKPKDDGKNDSGTSMHVFETGHDLDFDNVKVLGREQFDTRRRLREGIEILKVKDKTKLMNLMDGKQIDKCWLPFL